MSIVEILVLVAMLAAAVVTVVSTSVIYSAIGLGVTSALLTVAMFVVDASWAGVFELSICAGMISVVFVSTIGLTARTTKEEERTQGTKNLLRFAFLPPLLLVLALALLQLAPPEGQISVAPGDAASDRAQDVRDVMWTKRQDVQGQILLLLVGIFGVVVLFKERRKNV
jgi:NADH-quinone oxidoreductase subunit J